MNVSLRFLKGLPDNAYRLQRYFASCDECELEITWKGHLKKYKETHTLYSCLNKGEFLGLLRMVLRKTRHEKKLIRLEPRTLCEYFLN